MVFNAIQPGHHIPDDINVIIEIPAQSAPVKYEVDKESGAIFVDRFIATYMQYPCNYGYIPQTLSEDGDPSDVLVVSPHAINSGAVVRCRPIGMLEMTDEGGVDNKILAVPVEKLSRLYTNIKQPNDLPELLLLQINHFFTHYKDLEPEKWVKIKGWTDAGNAKKEIKACAQRYSAMKSNQQ